MFTGPGTYSAGIHLRRHPDIRNMELDYLRSNIHDTGIQAQIASWLLKLEQNQLPSGASEIFASIFASVFATLNGLQPPPKPSISEQKIAAVVSLCKEGEVCSGCQSDETHCSTCNTSWGFD